MAARGQSPKSTKFDPTNHILAWHLDVVHQIWTKFGMNIFLTLQTSLCKNLSVRAKSKMAARGQKSKIDQI